ncbi:hypothetical protein [Hymenobacter profundi]|uniref:Uncharacterized protein n=1 Tax=Hymenobacter profundi TaxID=1982110 RepID=A0ABS6WYY4_9BACT|nr:hypothetical protein [Hymenobacter profundi]MBW3128814.1 hypothetical protein [Hymenobacter profundi]
MSKQTVTLPNRSVHVEQVVDGRPGRPGIGLVYRGLGNKPAAVLFRNGLEQELTDFLRRQLPARPTDQALTLCIRQLRIGEQLNGLTEDASAALAADVYLHAADGYHLVQSVGASTSGRALETTALHAGHVASLLQQCLEQLTPPWPPTAQGPARTLTQLTADEAPVATSLGRSSTAGPTAAILRESPRRGVYRNFTQFLTNRPDSSVTVLTDTVAVRLYGHPAKYLWSGITRVRPVLVDGQGVRTHPKDLWGFSDGYQAYVQQGGSYFPLTRQHDFFTFVGEAPLDVNFMKAKSKTQASVMITGGVRVVPVPDHTGEPTAYALDMRTSQLAPYPDPLGRKPAQADTAYVYLYRRPDAAHPEAIPVFVGNQEIARLSPGQYVELAWPYYARILALRTGSQTVRTTGYLLVPNAARPTYLLLTPPAATTAAPVWQTVTNAQGEADLTSIDLSGTN